jgi:very-short-patch-repair endonuclease
MQKSAWKRMEKQSDSFISKAEKQFGEFIKTKLGLTVTNQYRSGLKPFDFLVEEKVLVEFDGPHHYDPDYYMCKSGKVDFQKQQERDKKREEIAKQLNMSLIVVEQRTLDKRMRLKGDAMHKFMGDLGYEVV